MPWPAYDPGKTEEREVPRTSAPLPFYSVRTSRSTRCPCVQSDMSGAGSLVPREQALSRKAGSRPTTLPPKIGQIVRKSGRSLGFGGTFQRFDEPLANRDRESSKALDYQAVNHSKVERIPQKSYEKRSKIE
ncbi:hypothetical protein KM043_014385 [Ampulex compressa]|nr:hypothetical protein KM043_014385 [Ampulex compressa]